MSSVKASLIAKKTGDVLLLKPKGNLVASTVDGQRASMMKALESPGKQVVLNLEAVDQIDSLGITLVLGLFKSSQKAGAVFSIEGVNPDIFRVFRLFNLPKFFSVTEAGS